MSDESKTLLENKVIRRFGPESRYMDIYASTRVEQTEDGDIVSNLTEISEVSVYVPMTCAELKTVVALTPKLRALNLHERLIDLNHVQDLDFLNVEELDVSWKSRRRVRIKDFYINFKCESFEEPMIYIRAMPHIKYLTILGYMLKLKDIKGLA